MSDPDVVGAAGHPELHGTALICLAVGAVASGSFLVPMKLVRKKYPYCIDPTYQTFWSMGVAFVSVLAMPVQCSVFDEDKCMKFRGLGFLASLFAAFGMIFTLIAVRHLGVAIPYSITVGSFILCGLLEGVFLFGDSPTNIFVFVLAIIVIMVAGTGVGYSKVKEIHDEQDELNEQSPLSPGRWFSAVMDVRTPTEELEHSCLEPGEDGGISAFSMSVLCSVGAGVMTSFALLTSRFSNDTWFGFLYSFGIGMLVVHVLLLPFGLVANILYGAGLPVVVKYNPDEAPTIPLDLKDTFGSPCSGPFPYAFTSGLLWGLGNAGLAFALTVGVNYVVAFSIQLSGLFVSGLWGIFVFRELKGWVPISIFFASATLLLGGTALQALALQEPNEAM